MKVGLNSYVSSPAKVSSPIAADAVNKTAVNTTTTNATKTSTSADLPLPDLRNVLKNPPAESSVAKAAQTIAKNREHMVAPQRPGKMFEVGVIRPDVSREKLVSELDRADKLAEEAFALASTGDDFDVMEALSKMDQAARIRQAVGKLAPEFQDRIRAANSLQKAGFMQLVQGTWEKDGATLSAGITDYKVAHEQFQLIKDDMLGVKHAPPQL